MSMQPRGRPAFSLRSSRVARAVLVASTLRRGASQPIGVIYQPLEDGGRPATEVYGRTGFLHWLRVHVDGRDIVVPAFEALVRPGEDSLHDGQGFRGLGPAVVEIDAEKLKLLPQPACADAKDEASCAVGVHGGDQLG